MARKPSINLDDRRDQVKLVNSAREDFRKTRFMPADKEIQNMLGDALLIWAKRESSTDIDEWFAEKEIGAMKFYNACQDNAYLDECLCIALTLIGSRVKEKIKDSYDFNMKMYPKYNSLSRLEAKQKRDADREQKVVTTFEVQQVHMPKFTKSTDDQA